MDDTEALDVETPLEDAVDSAMDGIAVLDTDGTYLYLNESHAELYGYDDREQLVGESWRSLYSDADVERFESEIMPAFEEAGEWRGEATGRRRDGTTFEQDLSLTRTEEGLVVCVVRDVTERIERRQRLQRYQTILQTIRDAVYTLDADGRITWVNEVAVEEFDVGYTREELVGSYVSKVLDAEDIEKCLDIIQQLLSDEEMTSGRCEVDIQTAHGEEIPCDLHLTLLPFEDGEFQGTVGVVRNISDRRRREQRLSVLNRVLRHNLRNDMNTVIGRAAVATQHCENAEEELRIIMETAREIVETGNRARQIAEALNRSADNRSAIDAVDIVESVCETARQKHQGVTITVDTPERCRVRANETLDVVVENLVENAIEHVSDPDVWVSVEPPSDGWVTVRVRDDGPGIPPEERDALSAAAETPLNHASGLGLWGVAWLVDSYGGRLSFGDADSDGGDVRVQLQALE